MGEAAQRGTKEERTEQAVEKKSNINKAIQERKHADGLVWLVIQAAESHAITDENGVFITHAGTNKLVYGPDPKTWKDLHPDSIPEWVKDRGVINELRKGVEVCKDPDNGGIWYRGVICAPPDNSEGKPS